MKTIHPRFLSLSARSLLLRPCLCAALLCVRFCILVAIYVSLYFSSFTTSVVPSCTYTDRIANLFPSSCHRRRSRSSNRSGAHNGDVALKVGKTPSGIRHTNTRARSEQMDPLRGRYHFFHIFFPSSLASYLALAMTLLVPIFIRLDKLLLCGAMARGHLYTF